MRRSPRNRLKTATLPPPSHPPPVLDTSLLVRPPSVEDLKRRGINFDSETQSQDSSSLSEFSSTTGTDERSVQSPMREFGHMTSPPINIDCSLLDNAQFSPTVIPPDSGYKDSLLSEVTTTSNAHGLLDSGITLTEDTPVISVLDDNCSPAAKPDVESKRKVPKRFKKAKSIDSASQQKVTKAPLQKSATVDMPDDEFLKPTRKGSRRFWEHSLVLIESDSDSDESLDLRSTPPPQSSYHANTDEPIVATGYSKIQVLGPKTSNKEETVVDSRKVSTEAKKDLTTVPVQYSNMEIIRTVADNKDSHDGRARSKSSSSKVVRKPKPLPRIQPVGEEGRSGLIASLPADFKQQIVKV